MKQVTWRTATPSADVFGVCSALFELGGMVVMHDPSGCNSTYTTHDEPRWYDTDSQIYISGLTEKEAMFGDTSRLYDDVAETAKLQQPKFICLIPSQMASMLGQDLKSVAVKLEKNLSVPVFTFPTNSIHYYSRGIYMAMTELARRFVSPPTKNFAPTANKIRVNLLGFTPLDFALHDAAECAALLDGYGVKVHTVWLMGANLTDLASAANVTANIVVSYGGLGAAKIMREKFGVPYIIGVPWAGMAEDIIAVVRRLPLSPEPVYLSGTCPIDENMFVIGDSIVAGSMAYLWSKIHGKRPQVICQVEAEPQLMGENDLCVQSEEELAQILAKAQTVMADPLYRVLCPAGTRFMPWPQPGISGRLYRPMMPHLFRYE